jgi:hypothetical protein
MAANDGLVLRSLRLKESIMNRRKIIQAAVLLSILPFLGWGPAFLDERAATDDIRAGRLEAYLSVLAADFTRGRETGSEGYDIAAEYAASLFKTWGVQPGGDVPDPLVRLRTGRGRSFFQAVPLVRNAADPETTMILTVARGSFRRETVFRRGTDFDVDPTVPFDVTAELVFAGYGSSDPDFNELGNLNLRDKIVVRLEGLPGETSPEGKLYETARDARQARMNRVNRAVESGEAGRAADDDPYGRFLKALRDGGAAGCITVALPPAGATASSRPAVAAGWSVNAPFRNLASPALKMYEGDLPPAKRKLLRIAGGPYLAPAGGPELFRDPGDPIFITVSPEAAEALFAPTGQTLDGLRRRIDSTARPASFPMVGALLRVRNNVETEIVNGKNVLGVIAGSDPILKNEVVVVGAHLDHIGASNNAIFNGADDNASGAAAVLELARAFSALPIPPKRTLVFGLWCGEEDGFLGSRYFLDRPYAPSGNIIACLNLDMIGRLPKPGAPPGGKLVVHTSCQTPLLKRIAEESCRQAGLDAEFLEEKFEGLVRSGGDRMDSDHVAFAARDIGFIYMETGVHEDWHSFLDHANKINYEGLEKITRAAFLSIREIAGLDARPVFDKSISAPRIKNDFRLILREDAEKEALPDPAATRPVPSAPSIAPSGKEKPSPDTRTVRLTFDLLGKTDESRFEGTITVSSGDRTVFSSDAITLRGFHQERIYSREFDVAGLDLAGAGLRWKISGTLFDSSMKDSLTTMNMHSRTFTEPFQGIGFHVSTAGGKLEVRPVVY